MSVAAWLRRTWLRRGGVAIALLPVSWLYGAVVAIRRHAYARGWLASTRVPVPVIVVGNVIAGGAGKTPVVMSIVNHLQAMGLKPGVVSRGHGRTATGCVEAKPESDARDVGDEPLLVARTVRVPVFVAARRVEAAQALLRAHPATNVIVCDDGLQHLALERDIEICVFDDRAIGNGWLLPAGPLREPWPRPVDLVVRTSGSEGIEGHVVKRQTRAAAIDSRGESKPLSSFASPVIALAAIARPESFFDALRAHGVKLRDAIALPDHDPLDGVANLLPKDADVLCTEKDAVKLWRTRPRAWSVPLDLAFEPAFWQEFESLVRAKLSSPHGPETA